MSSYSPHLAPINYTLYNVQRWGKLLLVGQARAGGQSKTVFVDTKGRILHYGNLRSVRTDTCKWAISKSTQFLIKVWVKLLLSAWKCLKRGPLTNWKFEPSTRPHTHSDPIINKHTEQVKKLPMDLSWHALNSVLQVKTFITMKCKNLATLGFQKIPDTPTKTRWSWAQSQKGHPTPYKTTYQHVCFSLLLFGCFSGPTNIHTQHITHSICFINSPFFFFLVFFFVFFFFKSKISSEHQNGTWKGHIKVTCPRCLFWLLPWENINRSTTLICRMWVMSSH